MIGYVCVCFLSAGNEQIWKVKLFNDNNDISISLNVFESFIFKAACAFLLQIKAAVRLYFPHNMADHLFR